MCQITLEWRVRKVSQFPKMKSWIFFIKLYLLRVLLNLQMVNFLKKVIFANSSKKCDQIFESFF